MKLKPVHVDGSLYVIIAMLAVVLASNHVTPEMLGKWSWIDYSMFFAAIALAGANALKTFRSESSARHRMETKIEEAKESGGGTTTTEISTKQVETETVATKVPETK